MPPIVTKRDLLDYMASLHACDEATRWVESAPDHQSAREIWERCDRYDWLIWLGGRRNPAAIAWFAKWCADRAPEGGWKQRSAHSAARADSYAHSAARAAVAHAAYSAAADAADARAYAADAAARAAACAAYAAADAADDYERKSQLTMLRSMWGTKGTQS